MRVKTIRDFLDVPAGSVLTECEDHGANYGGRWCSAMGSWWVEIPKAYCVEAEGDMSDRMKQALEQISSELDKMNDEDFRKLIERHKQGDFAIAYMKSLRGEV